VLTGGRRPGQCAQACCLAMAVTLALFIEHATAQGFFEALFGGAGSPKTPPSYQGQPHAYADPGRDGADPFAQRRRSRAPGDPFRPRRSREADPSSQRAPKHAEGSGGDAYCVRLCDGRYFPLQRSGEMNPAELCNAFCPATRTKVFYGNEIDSARAQDGTRYSALPHAFLFRQRLVADCTCNGKTPYGLATLDPTKDRTLRPGDIVATRRGLMAYRGSYSRRGVETANFTPVDKSRLAADRLGSVAVLEQN
jgi:Protein of unknown function (DUF2865)